MFATPLSPSPTCSFTVFDTPLTFVEEDFFFADSAAGRFRIEAARLIPLPDAGAGEVFGSALPWVRLEEAAVGLVMRAKNPSLLAAGFVPFVVNPDDATLDLDSGRLKVDPLREEREVFAAWWEVEADVLLSPFGRSLPIGADTLRAVGSGLVTGVLSCLAEDEAVGTKSRDETDTSVVVRVRFGTSLLGSLSWCSCLEEEAVGARRRDDTDTSVVVRVRLGINLLCSFS